MQLPRWSYEPHSRNSAYYQLVMGAVSIPSRLFPKNGDLQKLIDAADEILAGGRDQRPAGKNLICFSPQLSVEKQSSRPFFNQHKMNYLILNEERRFYVLSNLPIPWD